MDEVIKVENLSFRYTDEADLVLDDISLTIEKGEFLAILGHNGSGKSTLAKCLNAILLPTTGKVTVFGMDTAKEEYLFDIRQRVGMVFQNPDNQIVSSVVEEDIAFAPENLGVPREEIVRRVDYALAAVNMSEYRERSPSLLSGGQKQRIAIAGVIAMRPQVIVLDEPTAMLDPSGRQEILKVLHHLNKDEGITVVLITHHMDEAVEADRVLVMDDAHILLEGTPKYVFQNAALLSSVGLSVPQSVELMFELRKEGFSVPLSVLTANECVDVIEKLLKEGYACVAGN